MSLLDNIFKPNNTKINNFADLLLGGFGAGGAYMHAFHNPHVGSFMISAGLIIKGLAALTSEVRDRQG